MRLQTVTRVKIRSEPNTVRTGTGTGTRLLLHVDVKHFDFRYFRFLTIFERSLQYQKNSKCPMFVTRLSIIEISRSNVLGGLEDPMYKDRNSILIVILSQQASRQAIQPSLITRHFRATKDLPISQSTKPQNGFLRKALANACLDPALSCFRYDLLHDRTSQPSV